MDLNNQAALQQFDSLVGIRFQLYNSLFTSLPFHRIENTGILLSLFLLQCEEGYKLERSPAEIITGFMQQYTAYSSEAEKQDLLFRFVQYAERQVVLFDAIEDAAFPQMNDTSGRDVVRQLEMAAAKMPGRLEESEVRLVLTAHPTQFYNGAVLGIISDLSEALREDHPHKINDYLRQLGRTPFFKKEKPSPYDEAINLVWYLEHIFYPAVGNLAQQVQPAGGADASGTPAHIRIGFWPGGDRDGNQFVKTETTLRVAAALNRRILRCYHRDLRALKRRLTFRQVEEAVARLERSVYAALFDDDRSLTVAGMLEQLAGIRELLHREHNDLFIELVDALAGRVRIFGLHFASLDIRQDSGVHARILTSLSEKRVAVPPGYRDLTEDAKIAALGALRHNGALPLLDDEVEQDVLEVMAAVREIQSAGGEAACHRYIISHCTSAADVLAVRALFLLCGWAPDSLSVDIVPLFETIEDLRACGRVMESLYGNEQYRAHLRNRGNRQTIMLGFSDGTKDGGYLMANWAIYKAKEALTAIARAQGVEVVFFDGRGGPPARGGGKTQKFYASMGDNIANREIQLTIQGQTISSNFGTVPTAQHNIGQLLSAAVAGRLRAAEGPTMTESEAALLDELATVSYGAYAALKSAPGFLDYLNEVSPLRFYADTNIGSRPAKRKDGQLNLDDLRAIPYVGAWSQLKQNVPGYYGLGTALQQIRNSGRWEHVQELYRQSAYFRTLLDNCEMAMKKCYFPLTAYLAREERYREIWTMVHEEYRLTREWLLALSGQAELMANYAVNAASIGMRDRIVLPLLTIQQYALAGLRDEAVQRPETLERLVVRCSFGIINASRNAV